MDTKQPTGRTHEVADETFFDLDLDVSVLVVNAESSPMTESGVRTCTVDCTEATCNSTCRTACLPPSPCASPPPA